jgi:hypothetical protein
VVWTALTVSAGLALVLCYAVGSQQLLLGDRHAGWLYPYIATFGVRSIGVALIAAAIATTMLAVLPRPDERNEWLVVGAWIVVGLVLQLLVRSLGSFSMTCWLNSVVPVQTGRCMRKATCPARSCCSLRWRCCHRVRRS